MMIDRYRELRRRAAETLEVEERRVREQMTLEAGRLKQNLEVERAAQLEQLRCGH